AARRRLPPSSRPAASSTIACAAGLIALTSAPSRVRWAVTAASTSDRRFSRSSRAVGLRAPGRAGRADTAPAYGALTVPLIVASLRSPSSSTPTTSDSWTSPALPFVIRRKAVCAVRPPASGASTCSNPWFSRIFRACAMTFFVGCRDARLRVTCVIAGRLPFFAASPAGRADDASRVAPSGTGKRSGGNPSAYRATADDGSNVGRSAGPPDAAAAGRAPPSVAGADPPRSLPPAHPATASASPTAAASVAGRRAGTRRTTDLGTTDTVAGETLVRTAHGTELHHRHPRCPHDGPWRARRRRGRWDRGHEPRPRHRTRPRPHPRPRRTGSCRHGRPRRRTR